MASIPTEVKERPAASRRFRKDGSIDKFGWGARSEEEPKKEPEVNPVETLSQKKSKQTRC